MSKEKKQAFEICANCGKVADEKDSKSGIFRCSKCGCDVSVMLPRAMFAQIAKQFGKQAESQGG